MNLRAKDLLAGQEASISGDGWTENITASASIVDGKPLYFLSTYELNGNGENPVMVATESFKTLKALKEGV